MSRLTIEQLLNHCGATCEKYGLWGKVNGFTYREHDSVRKYLKELQHYKDLEEQGRLIVQKQGEWYVLDNTHTLFQCSACGKIQEIRWNYCPNCGAKMDEVENE